VVESHGWPGAYKAVKRFAGSLCQREPEQFDRQAFAPGDAHFAFNVIVSRHLTSACELPFRLLDTFE
jgi:hypothetical protein